MRLTSIIISAAVQLAAAKPLNYDLAARQLNATTPTSIANSTLPTTSIAPTATPTDINSTSIDLNHSIINQPLGTAELLGLQIPPTCLNCSTFGILHVTAGDFEFDGNPFHDDAGFSGGHFHAEACGMAGVMEVEVEALTLEKEIDLPFKVPIAGFSIPDVGAVGVFIQWSIILDLQFDTFTNVTVGFDFAVPEGAFVDVDLVDLHKSSSYGFQPSEGLIINQHPIQANVSGLDFTASATLRTQLLFGLSDFKVAGLDVEANAGVFLDLPKLIVEEDQVSNVDDQCNSVVMESIDGVVQYIGSATNIKPSIAADIGVQAQAGLTEHDISWSFDDSITMVGTTIALPTACITPDAGTATAAVLAVATA